MFVLAIGMTGYAWWHNYNQSKRIAKAWGNRAGAMIRQAPDVTLFLLSPGEAEEVLMIGGQPFGVRTEKAVGQSRGLIHVRHLLAEDSYYDWEDEMDTCTPIWSFALRFQSRKTRVTLVFDRQCRKVMMLENGRTLRLGEVSRQLEEFVDELY